jgi:hypothetical protein
VPPPPPPEKGIKLSEMNKKLISVIKRIRLMPRPSTIPLEDYRLEFHTRHGHTESVCVVLCK